jgi:hypothetical protein
MSTVLEGIDEKRKPDLIGYRNIQDSFNVFSKIFGFGIENEWCSNKESFVESLKEIISTPNK